MKMTLEIPDDLFREVKAKAASEGKKLKDLVADSLRSSLVDKTMPMSHEHSKFPLIKSKGSIIPLEDKEVAAIEDNEEAKYYASFMRR